MSLSCDLNYEHTLEEYAVPSPTSKHGYLDVFFSHLIWLIPISGHILWLNGFSVFWLFIWTGSILAVIFNRIIRLNISTHVHMLTFNWLFIWYVHPHIISSAVGIVTITYMAYTRVIVFVVHSWIQVLVGAMLGAVQAYIAYELSNKVHMLD